MKFQFITTKQSNGTFSVESNGGELFESGFNKTQAEQRVDYCNKVLAIFDNDPIGLSTIYRFVSDMLPLI